MANTATIQRRAAYLAFDDQVNGVRRPPCNDSALIVEADTSWRLNPRVDVTSVGAGVQEDIRVGDVAWVIPKGDHRELNKLEDPQLIQTWERFIHAVIPSRRAKGRDGKDYAVVELDHTWRFEQPGGQEIVGAPGDLRLMALDTLEMSIVRKEHLAEVLEEDACATSAV